MICKRRNKNYKNRKLVIYQNENDKKPFCYVESYSGWLCYSVHSDKETHMKMRELVMQDLYWLLGHGCSYEDWKDSIEKWDSGLRIYNVEIDKLPNSLFCSNEEKQIALDSYHNS